MGGCARAERAVARVGAALLFALFSQGFLLSGRWRPYLSAKLLVWNVFKSPRGDALRRAGAALGSGLTVPRRAAWAVVLKELRASGGGVPLCRRGELRGGLCVRFARG